MYTNNRTYNYLIIESEIVGLKIAYKLDEIIKNEPIQ
jgi:hypothetical protein